MTQKSFFEQIGGIYTQVDSFLLPDLDVKDCEPTGKYGRTRKQYQKEQF